MVGALTGLGVTVLMTADLVDSYTELRPAGPLDAHGQRENVARDTFLDVFAV